MEQTDHYKKPDLNANTTSMPLCIFNM